LTSSAGHASDPDRLYADAHRYRVGTHYEMLPVNRPRNPVHTYHAAGPMRFDEPRGTNAYYEPGSFGGPRQDAGAAEPPLRISGDADRYNHRDGNDDTTQAGNLLRMFTPEQKGRLFQNIAASMAGVPDRIIQRQLVHFHRADPAYAAGVARALGVPDEAARA
jgi:catalase